VIAEALAPVATLIEPMLLNHGAHRTVEEHDALLEQLLQSLDTHAALDLVYGSYSEGCGGDPRASALLTSIQ
jgi:hypothetical protein